MRSEQPVAVGDHDTLGSLPQWLYLVAMCGKCSHHSPLDRGRLMKKYGAGGNIKLMATLLRCNQCRNTQFNMIGVLKMPR
jgi:hypothetical protein